MFHISTKQVPSELFKAAFGGRDVQGPLGQVTQRLCKYQTCVTWKLFSSVLGLSVTVDCHGSTFVCKILFNISVKPENHENVGSVTHHDLESSIMIAVTRSGSVSHTEVIPNKNTVSWSNNILNCYLRWEKPRDDELIIKIIIWPVNYWEKGV